MERSEWETPDNIWKFHSLYNVRACVGNRCCITCISCITCTCFPPASAPYHTYTGIASRLYSHRPTPIYVWGDADIRVRRYPYTFVTLIRSRLAMVILPPLSYASLGNRPRKTRARLTACNPYHPFSEYAYDHTSAANDPSRICLLYTSDAADEL